MKIVRKIVTVSDGIVHDSQREALQHLNNVYADKIGSLGRKILEIAREPKSYTTLTDFIDQNLTLFIELQKVKNDFDLIDDGDE